MTTPNSPEQKLIEALELIKNNSALWADATANYKAIKDNLLSIDISIEQVFPIARSLLSELAELREKAKRYDEMMIAQKEQST